MRGEKMGSCGGGVMYEIRGIYGTVSATAS